MHTVSGLERRTVAVDGNMALVYASNTPSFLAGTGICAVLEKQADQWRVTGYAIVWIS